MRMTRTAISILTAILLVQTVFAQTPGTWDEVVKQCKESGLSTRRVRAIKLSCEEAGISAKEAWSMMRSAVFSPEDNVVLDKIQEGLAKGISPAAIQPVVQRRRRALFTARRLAVQADTPQRNVVVAVMHAVESGVDELLLAILLQDRQGLSVSEIRSSVRATESLSLGGFNKRDVRTLTKDLMSQRMSEAQMQHAVAHANYRKASGTSATVIREELRQKPAGLLQMRTMKRSSRLYRKGRERSRTRDVRSSGKGRSKRGGEEYAIIDLRDAHGYISLHAAHPDSVANAERSKLTKAEKDAAKAARQEDLDASKAARDAAKEAAKAERAAEKDKKDK